MSHVLILVAIEDRLYEVRYFGERLDAEAQRLLASLQFLAPE